nr:DUF3488 domain-containing protein [Planctomycetota bacterium]
MITPHPYQPRFSTLAWLMGAMALATSSFITLLPIWLPCALLALGVIVLTRRWFGKVPPQLGLLRMLVLAVATIGLLWATHHLGVGIDAAAPLFVAFLWFKLLELHSERDVMRACFLSLFLVTAQLLIAQSLAQMLYAMVASLGVLGVLVHLHVVGPEGSGMVDRQPLRTAARSLRTAAVIVAQALPFAAILFIFIPRPEIGPGLDQKNAISGVSDVLDPNQIAQVAKSTQPAFRVEFTGGMTPAPDACYWRGVVLWHTDGSSWDRKLNAPDRVAIGAAAIADVVTATALADRTSYVVALQPHYSRWLYTLDAPVAMVRVDTLEDLRLSPGLVFQQSKPIAVPLVYRGESGVAAQAKDHPLPYYRPSSPPSAAEVRERSRSAYLLTPPKLDSRIVALAERLSIAATVDGRVDAKRLIAQTLDYFRREGFVYTLQPGEMGPNGTATFLFEKKRGFCGHYSNAFSLLVRLAGVPSRVVVGYYGGEINPIGGFMIVRQS